MILGQRQEPRPDLFFFLREQNKKRVKRIGRESEEMRERGLN